MIVMWLRLISCVYFIISSCGVFFGYIPYYETNLGLDDITTVPQLQPDEVYAKLIEDLDNNVIGKLPKIVPANEKGRATNGAAIAMKARIVSISE